MLGFVKKSLGISILAISLAGCASMQAKFNDWGQAMPTYQDRWCKSFICWGDETTTKQEAFRPSGNVEKGGNMPLGRGPVPEFGQAREQQQSQEKEKAKKLNEYGFPTADAAYGSIQKEGGTAETKSDDVPWQYGQPPKKNAGSIGVEQGGQLPPGYDPNRELPPGAVPGVNWPPPPPEDGYPEDPYNADLDNTILR